MCLFKVQYILLQKQPNMKITIVRLTDEMENISPVLTDVIMRAGYKAIDILCDKVVAYNHYLCTLIIMTHFVENIGQKQ